MKLSIFPKADALPSSKEEKSQQAWYTSKPHLPEVVEVRTSGELIDIVCQHAWSPSTFSSFRNQHNFMYTDFMVLDIDEGMTIEEAEKVVHKLDIATLCLPSTSHTEEEHRFRLIFPLSRSITTAEEFEATMFKLAEHFPADPACLGDQARFFFGGKKVDGFWYSADLLVPTKAQVKPKMEFNTRASVIVGESLEELTEALYGEKREKVPEPVAYFLENAPNNLSGEWYMRSNSFLFTCGLLSLDHDRVAEVFFSLYPHDELTELTVYKMWNDGYTSRDEEL